MVNQAIPASFSMLLRKLPLVKLNYRLLILTQLIAPTPCVTQWNLGTLNSANSQEITLLPNEDSCVCVDLCSARGAHAINMENTGSLNSQHCQCIFFTDTASSSNPNFRYTSLKDVSDLTFTIIGKMTGRNLMQLRHRQSVRSSPRMDTGASYNHYQEKFGHLEALLLPRALHCIRGPHHCHGK